MSVSFLHSPKAPYSILVQLDLPTREVEVASAKHMHLEKNGVI